MTTTAERIDALEQELYRKETGYKTALLVAPGGAMESQDAVIEIVVLDYDGATLAYRYSDHGTDRAWTIGTITDAVAELEDAIQHGLDAASIVEDDD